MEAFLVSTGVVALAELGDKTQLLALVLAARFRAPVPVLAGIVTAVLVNQTLAGVAGTLLAAVLAPDVLRWLLVASFIVTAVWMLVPDKEPAAGTRPARFGAYGTTVVTFFLVEIGDKTQIATLATRRQVSGPRAGGRRHDARDADRGRAGGAARAGGGREASGPADAPHWRGGIPGARSARGARGG